MVSGTWLISDVNDFDIQINGFRTPFRKDRIGDGYGGIAVYVKNNIPSIHGADLEILNTECIWVELRLHNRRILVGTFYRPPNSENIVLSNIENSIDLAVDTKVGKVLSARENPGGKTRVFPSWAILLEMAVLGNTG